jgi:hypothetical protein
MEQYGQAADKAYHDKGSTIEKAPPTLAEYAQQLHSSTEHLRDKLLELRSRLDSVLRPAGPTSVDESNAKRPQVALSPLAAGVLTTHAMVDELHGIVNDMLRRLHL